MIPLVTPIGVLAVLVALRGLGRVRPRYTLVDAAAWSLSSLLLLTGTAHFVGPLREDMVRMVPPLFPRPDLIVAVTGALELLAVVGLLWPRARSLTGIALALLFVAMLPANIYAAKAGLTFGGKPARALWERIPEQLLYIGLALAPWWTTRRQRPRQPEAGDARRTLA